MDITPLEIQNKTFNRSFRGYDVEEVEEFLKDLIGSYENIYSQNRELKDRISMLEDKVGYYRGMEETLKETLVLAQKTSTEIVASAHKEAELILESARQNLREESLTLRNEISELESYYGDLKNQIRNFKSRQIAYFESEIETLKEETINLEDH